MTGSIERVDLADRLLAGEIALSEAVWARAVVWLLRLAVEHALDELWAARNPGVGACQSRTAQLLVLPKYADDNLAARAAFLWYSLSHAAHHHDYELALSDAEVRQWRADVGEIVEQLRARQVPGGR